MFSPAYIRHLAQQASIMEFPLLWEWKECLSFDVATGSAQIISSYISYCHTFSCLEICVHMYGWYYYHYVYIIYLQEVIDFGGIAQMFNQGAHHPTVLVVLQALTTTIGEVCICITILWRCCTFYVLTCALECCIRVTAEKQDQDSILVAGGTSITWWHF